MKTALYPGSFDPFTIAHQQIVETALTIFDKVVIGVGYNITKSGFYTLDKRVEIITKSFEGCDNVEVCTYDTLTVDLCNKLGVNHIVRGVRSFADFEAEKTLSEINKILAPNIVTLYLTTAPEYSSVSSSAVRELVKFGADVTNFIPKGVKLPTK